MELAGICFGKTAAVWAFASSSLVCHAAGTCDLPSKRFSRLERFEGRSVCVGIADSMLKHVLTQTLSFLGMDLVSLQQWATIIGVSRVLRLQAPQQCSDGQAASPFEFWNRLGFLLPPLRHQNSSKECRMSHRRPVPSAEQDSTRFLLLRGNFGHS